MNFQIEIMLLATKEDLFYTVVLNLYSEQIITANQ